MADDISNIVKSVEAIEQRHRACDVDAQAFASALEELALTKPRALAEYLYETYGLVVYQDDEDGHIYGYDAGLVERADKNLAEKIDSLASARHKDCVQGR